MDYVNDVLVWILQVHHVKLNREWLEECINWLRQQNVRLESKKDMRDAVFEQWISADITESMTPCFPASVIQSTSLTGTFAVQMNAIWDVGESFYSQLQKLDPMTSDNIEVCEDRTEEERSKPTQNKGKSHSRTNMMMELTDGKQSVIAMEYKPIPCLNVKISPGTKVLIKSEVQCSLGMLLLTSDNVKLLGGEVDNLVTEHTQENVLKRLIRNKGNWNETTDIPVGSNINRAWRPGANLASSLPVLPRSTVAQKQPKQEKWEMPTAVEEERNYFVDDDDDMFDENVLKHADAVLDDQISIDGLDIGVDQNLDQNDVPDQENSSRVNYLSEISSAARQSGPSFLHVNARVTGLASKLQHSAKTGWKLVVNIDDGTDSLQAVMSDPVLAQLLGLTSQEAKVLKASSDKTASRQRFDQCVARGKERLQDLHCMMEVTVENGSVLVTALL